MSAVAREWLKRRKIEGRTLNAVLGAIVELDNNGRCQATQARLARRARLKERAVRNAVALLGHFKIISREASQRRKSRGRAADVITVALGRDFTITKAEIAAARKLGATGTKGMGATGIPCRLNDDDQPASRAGSPKAENRSSLYKERARGNTGILSSAPTCSIRTWFEKPRRKWRAFLRYRGTELDLGRFDSRDEAEAFAAQSKEDVLRTSLMKNGAPSRPTPRPDLMKLTGEDFMDWMDFGAVVEPSEPKSRRRQSGPAKQLDLFS